MKVVIPGGSGHVGRLLAGAFRDEGAEVVVLSRQPTPAPWRVVAWDAQHLGPWVNELDGADAVINLAGRSVNCRYHASNRRAILESRVRSTAIVGKAIAEAARPPRVWLQASTATIYDHRYDAAHDETSTLIGTDQAAPPTWRFSTGVATAWERATEEAETPATRKVLLRMAMVMDPGRGGVFDVLLGLVRAGLGGTNGNGRQYISWIHDADFVRAVRLLLDGDLTGPVNLASPNPLPNADFLRELRRAAGVRFGLPATRWMLEVGAFCMRTETELILKSRRVVPGRLLTAGFRFEYADWPTAAADLYRRWRAGV